VADKPKLSMYWGASCGGCEIALANIHEKILDVDANFDFMFCPCLLDTKKKDIEALPDGAIFITLFNGAIRTAENEEMAHLLRKKSKLLIAFGACASQGSIPSLGNLASVAEIFQTVYRDAPTTVNPKGIIPQPETKVPEGVLELPPLLERVKTLAEIADVDYFIPGCPPEPERIWDVIDHVVQGKPLPPKGSVLGGGDQSVCEECERTKADKKITRLYRPHEIIPDPEQCLLEQGVVCMGPATRNGCGALCPKVNMPCGGCYGPPEGVCDQGARMAAALGSIIDIEELKGISEETMQERILATIAAIPDYAGTFYKYTLAGSILKGRKGA